MGLLSLRVIDIPGLEMQACIPRAPETEAGGLRDLRGCLAASASTTGVTRPVTALGLVDVSAGTTSLLESWMHVQPLRHQLPLSNCKS